MGDEKPMGQVIQIDEARIRDHLGEMVRGTVEETLNAMLDAEADRLCGAGCYSACKFEHDGGFCPAAPHKFQFNHVMPGIGAGRCGVTAGSRW